MSRDDDDETNFSAKAFCKKATERALLLKIEGRESEIWVPQSAIHDDSEVFDDRANRLGKVVIKHWWASENGLI